MQAQTYTHTHVYHTHARTHAHTHTHTHTIAPMEDTDSLSVNLPQIHQSPSHMVPNGGSLLKERVQPLHSTTVLHLGKTRRRATRRRTMKLQQSADDAAVDQSESVYQMYTYVHTQMYRNASWSLTRGCVSVFRARLASVMTTLVMFSCDTDCRLSTRTPTALHVHGTQQHTVTHFHSHRQHTPAHVLHYANTYFFDSLHLLPPPPTLTLPSM